MFTLSTVSCGGTGLEEDTLLVDLLKCEIFCGLSGYLVYCFVYVLHHDTVKNDLESKNNNM